MYYAIIEGHQNTFRKLIVETNYVTLACSNLILPCCTVLIENFSFYYHLPEPNGCYAILGCIIITTDGP